MRQRAESAARCCGNVRSRHGVVLQNRAGAAVGQTTLCAQRRFLNAHGHVGQFNGRRLMAERVLLPTGNDTRPVTRNIASDIIWPVSSAVCRSSMSLATSTVRSSVPDHKEIPGFRVPSRANEQQRGSIFTDFAGFVPGT